MDANIPKLSLLRRDTRTRIKKITDNLFDEKNIDPTNKDPKQIKLNKDPKHLLNKIGIGNTFQGTREVFNYQKNVFQKNKQLKESTMSISIPIKDIILEFTADQFRDNANKASAATWLGAGALGGYVAGGGEIQNPFSSGHHSAEITPTPGTPATPATPAVTDSDNEVTIKLPKNTQHHVDYGTGAGGGFMDHLRQYGEDQANIEHHKKVLSVAQSQPNQNWLDDKIESTVKPIAYGAAGIGTLGLGAMALAARGRRR